MFSCSNGDKKLRYTRGSQLVVWGAQMACESDARKSSKRRRGTHFTVVQSVTRSTSMPLAIRVTPTGPSRQPWTTTLVARCARRRRRLVGRWPGRRSQRAEDRPRSRRCYGDRVVFRSTSTTVVVRPFAAARWREVDVIRLRADIVISYVISDVIPLLLLLQATHNDHRQQNDRGHQRHAEHRQRNDEHQLAPKTATCLRRWLCQSRLRRRYSVHLHNIVPTSSWTPAAAENWIRRACFVIRWSVGMERVAGADTLTPVHPRWHFCQRGWTGLMCPHKHLWTNNV